jgi:putative transposase
MCKTLGVARSGFYAWLDQPVSSRARDNDRLLKVLAPDPVRKAL